MAEVNTRQIGIFEWHSAWNSTHACNNFPHLIFSILYNANFTILCLSNKSVWEILWPSLNICRKISTKCMSWPYEDDALKIWELFHACTCNILSNVLWWSLQKTWWVLARGSSDYLCPHCMDSCLGESGNISALFLGKTDNWSHSPSHLGMAGYQAHSASCFGKSGSSNRLLDCPKLC